MIDPSRIRNLGIMIAAAVTCAISTFANSAEPKINAVEGPLSFPAATSLQRSQLNLSYFGLPIPE
jgi:hypothetical protein